MYDLGFRTDVRFREVWCKAGNFYWHSSRRQLVRVMLTLFLCCLGKSFEKMERAEEDLETSPARWKRLSSSRQIDHQMMVIQSPVCKALEELERDFFYYLHCSQGGFSLSDLPVC